MTAARQHTDVKFSVKSLIYDLNDLLMMLLTVTEPTKNEEIQSLPVKTGGFFSKEALHCTVPNRPRNDR